MRNPKRVTWNESASGADNARRHLPAIVAAYFAQGRELLAGKMKPSDLNGLRRSTGRLRYTIELFRSCYGPGLRARIAMLQRIQQVLGEVNDCAAAARMLADYSKKNSPQRERLSRFLEQRNMERIAEFRRIWMQEFDAPGQERAWSVYLARHTRRAVRQR